MIYLKNNDCKTLIEIEIISRDNRIKDILSTIHLAPYSELLLQQEDKNDVIEDFEFLMNLRKWLCEGMYHRVDYSYSMELLREILDNICKKYDLFIYYNYYTLPFNN